MKQKLVLVLFTLLVLISYTGYSQTLKYDSDFKYKNVLSNCEIRPFISGSHELKNGGLKNFGVGLGVTKRVGDYWRLRAQGEVNGLLPNGFDRYAKLLYGGSFDLLPFYVFGQTGFVYNPSDGNNPINGAVNTGVGLQFKYLFIEAAVDRVSHGNYWTSDATVYAGCNIPLGIMKSDAKNQQLDQTVHQNYGNLIQENRQLKSEVARQEVMTKQLQELTARNDSLFKLMDARLKACESENKQLITEAKTTSIGKSGNCIGEPIYFEFASSDITYDQDRNIANIARIIRDNPGNYTITGYCSNNGGDYSNQKLSENRAWSVYDRLIEFGVNKDYLISTGEGKTEIFSEFDEHSNQCVIVRKSNY